MVIPCHETFADAVDDLAAFLGVPPADLLSPVLVPPASPPGVTTELTAALRALATAVQQQATPATEWLDAPAAAKHLGLPSLKALYQLVRGGDVLAHKLGRRLRFARADLDAVVRGGALSSRSTVGR